MLAAVHRPVRNALPASNRGGWTSGALDLCQLVRVRTSLRLRTSPEVQNGVSGRSSLFQNGATQMSVRPMARTRLPALPFARRWYSRIAEAIFDSYKERCSAIGGVNAGHGPAAMRPSSLSASMVTAATAPRGAKALRESLGCSSRD
jgi:hypothetical protein